MLIGVLLCISPFLALCNERGNSGLNVKGTWKLISLSSDKKVIDKGTLKLMSLTILVASLLLFIYC